MVPRSPKAFDAIRLGHGSRPAHAPNRPPNPAKPQSLLRSCIGLGANSRPAGLVTSMDRKRPSSNVACWCADDRHMATAVGPLALAEGCVPNAQTRKRLLPKCYRLNALSCPPLPACVREKE